MKKKENGYRNSDIKKKKKRNESNYRKCLERRDYSPLKQLSM